MRIGIRCYVMVSAVLLASATARAEQLGPTFQVNAAPKSPEFYSSVGAHPDGRYVVSWQVKLPNPPDKASRIHAQRFDADGGRLGDEIAVSKKGGFATHSSVAYLDDGRFVVIWNRLRKRGALRLIRGRLFDEKGMPVGPVFEVTDTASKKLHGVSVEALPNGRFAVIWAIRKGVKTRVSGQLFNKKGSKRGENIVFEDLVSEIRGTPRISSFGQKSKFVIVFDGVEGNSPIGQVFNRDGSPFSKPFNLSESTSTSGNAPDVTAFGKKKFIATWTGTEIRTRVFNARGKPTGPSNIAVSPDNSGASPLIAALSDGDSIIAWRRNDTGDDDKVAKYSIQVRRLDSTGSPVGTEATMISFGKLRELSLAGLADGRYVVIWGQRSPLNVYGRMSE